jgi:hypothetical protein
LWLLALILDDFLADQTGNPSMHLNGNYLTHYSLCLALNFSGFEELLQLTHVAWCLFESNLSVEKHEFFIKQRVLNLVAVHSFDRRLATQSRVWRLLAAAVLMKQFGLFDQRRGLLCHIKVAIHKVLFVHESCNLQISNREPDVSPDGLPLDPLDLAGRLPIVLSDLGPFVDECRLILDNWNHFRGLSAADQRFFVSVLGCDLGQEFPLVQFDSGTCLFVYKTKVAGGLLSVDLEAFGSRPHNNVLQMLGAKLVRIELRGHPLQVDLLSHLQRQKRVNRVQVGGDIWVFVLAGLIGDEGLHRVGLGAGLVACAVRVWVEH